MTQRFGVVSLAGAAAAVMLAQAFHPIMLIVLRDGENAAWLAVILSGAAAAR